jgi:hypothetical protein
MGSQFGFSLKLYPALKDMIGGSFYGYINDRGIFIIKPKYQKAYDFNEFGTAIVAVNNYVGVINIEGEYVVKPFYESLSQYKEGRVVYVLNGNMGVMDEKGNVITKKPYNYISDFNDGIAIIGVSNKEGSYGYGYIDKDGNEIVNPKFLSADEFVEDRAIIQFENKEYGLINKDGIILITYKYQYVGKLGNGLMVFSDKSTGLLGYINKEGKEIIKPIYNEANRFKDGIAVVSFDEGLYGAIDLNGKYVYDPIYSEIHQLGESRVALGMPLSEGNGRRSSIYAIGDNIGNRLTNFNYLSVGNYDGEVAYASDKLNTFFIDKNGNINKNLPIVRGSGELIVKDNIIFANIDFSPYYLKKSGKVIYKPNDIIVLSDNYSVKKVKYKPNINYLIYYPEVNGVAKKKIKMEINVKLKQMSYFKTSFEEGTKSPVEISSDDVLNYNYYGNFLVIFFKKNLLVLDITGYYYRFGAAHGMPSKKTPCIDLRRGEFYNLRDLFMAGVYWTSELNEIIENMINTNPQYEYIFKESFKGIAVDQDFYIDDNNLYIYFPPYEIGPYAAGFVTFKIPFAQIEGMINKKGNFYKAFN